MRTARPGEGTSGAEGVDLAADTASYTLRVPARQAADRADNWRHADDLFDRSLIDLAVESWPFQRVRTRRSGYFMPDAEGVEMAVIPVHDGALKLVDLVAYEVRVPGRWWLRTGLGRALGEFAIEFAHDYRLPVILVQTPDEWIRHPSPLAVCVLQRARAGAILAGVETTTEGPRRGA